MSELHGARQASPNALCKESCGARPPTPPRPALRPHKQPERAEHRFPTAVFSGTAQASLQTNDTEPWAQMHQKASEPESGLCCLGSLVATERAHTKMAVDTAVLLWARRWLSCHQGPHAVCSGRWENSAVAGCVHARDRAVLLGPCSRRLMPHQRVGMKGERYWSQTHVPCHLGLCRSCWTWEGGSGLENGSTRDGTSAADSMLLGLLRRTWQVPQVLPTSPAELERGR